MKNIGVFAFIEQDHQILLVKKAYGNKKWSLPGGAVEAGEDLITALKREVKEETNQEITKFEFIASFYNQPKYEIAFCYKVTIKNMQSFTWNPNELEKVEFFNLDKLPEDLSPKNKQKIEYYQKNKNTIVENLITTI